MYSSSTGRSINGANGNRLQTVSVVASTSSEAILPELDFVFNKKPIHSNAKPQPKGHQNYPQSQTPSTSPDSGSFEEISPGLIGEDNTSLLDSSSILDENSPLYRLLSSRTKILDGNQLPGTAASNRNIASQQLVFSKNPSKNASRSQKKNVPGTVSPNDPATASFTPSTPSQTFVTGSFPQTETPSGADGDINQGPGSGESFEVKTLKTGTGTILVFNRTQLITVPVTLNGNNNGLGGVVQDRNSTSGLVLLEHDRQVNFC